jgi:hypothetical protein
MLEPGLVDPSEGLVIDAPEIDAADFRTDQRVPRRQRDAFVHVA